MKEFNLYRGSEAEPIQLLSTEVPVETSPQTISKVFNLGIFRIGEVIQLKFEHSNYSGFMQFTGLESSSEFVVKEDTCKLAAGSCFVLIEFTARTEGEKTATARSTNFNEFGDPIFNFETRWTNAILENLQEPECKLDIDGSILNVDGKSVAEIIPVTGAPFDLYYSSSHSEEYDSEYEGPFLLNNFNPESWSISIIHTYNASEKNLFPGAGGRATREASVDPSGNHLVVNGDEVYKFDAGGKHLETHLTLTGRLIYSFAYTADNKIHKITDAFGKQTVFLRDADGKLQSIIAPFGQMTTIELDDLGRILRITDPQNQTHTISYQEDADLIASFTKPSGMRSDFTFENGYLTTDVANGGNSWTLVPGAEGTAHKTELISKLNRKTIYVKDNDYSTGLYTRTEIAPSGFATTYTENTDLSFTRSNPFESTRQSTVPDERFGAALNRPSRREEVVDGVTRLTEYLQSVILSNPSDPYSYSQITSTKKVNDAVTTSVFNKATLTSVTTNPSGVVSTMTIDEFERPILMKLGNDAPVTMSYDSLGRKTEVSQGTTVSRYSYNPEGYLSSITNALNQVTSYNYDAAGRVIQTIMPDGRIIGLSYDPDGRISGVTPPGRPTHNFSFNLMGLTQSYEPPLLPGLSSTQTSYIYNEDKQLTSIQRPDGRNVNYAYNAVTGLLEARDGQVYTYFPNTELVQSINSEDGVLSQFTYFGTQTIKSEKQSFEGQSYEVAYSFDNFFRPQQKVTKLNDQIVNTVNTTYRADGA
ncbi:MAG: RHS repeat domain-containing protein, partial [Bacteriovoracia bacterium]